MSKNLKISEGRSSQSRLSCHSNETAPPGSMPQDSWINAGFLGHECGMFTQNDKVEVSTTEIFVAIQEVAPERGLNLRRAYESI